MKINHFYNGCHYILYSVLSWVPSYLGFIYWDWAVFCWGRCLLLRMGDEYSYGGHYYVAMDVIIILLRVSLLYLSVLGFALTFV